MSLFDNMKITESKSTEQKILDLCRENTNDSECLSRILEYLQEYHLIMSEIEEDDRQLNDKIRGSYDY